MTLTDPKAHAVTHIRFVASARSKGIGYQTGHADGWWGVHVTPDGLLQFEGYAEDSYARGTPLEQLDWRELGALLDACERAGFPY